MATASGDRGIPTGLVVVLEGLEALRTTTTPVESRDGSKTSVIPTTTPVERRSLRGPRRARPALGAQNEIGVPKPTH